jgi:hypothetical protein
VGVRWLAPLIAFIPVQLAASTVETEQPRDYSKMLDKQNIEFLRNLATLLETKGFKDVQIIPQMFVAKARNSAGKEVTIIFDYNTLKALSFEGELPLANPKESQPETVLPQLR